MEVPGKVRSQVVGRAGESGCPVLSGRQKSTGFWPSVITDVTFSLTSAFDREASFV